jgi:hypothetical protein
VVAFVVRRLEKGGGSGVLVKGLLGAVGRFLGKLAGKRRKVGANKGAKIQK